MVELRDLEGTAAFLWVGLDKTAARLTIWPG
jgi:hypothetical protein